MEMNAGVAIQEEMARGFGIDIEKERALFLKIIKTPSDAYWSVWLARAMLGVS